MSVANVIFEAHRIRLLSDKLAYCERVPVAFNRKVRVARHAHVAVTVRGLVALGDEIEARSDGWACFQTAVQNITADLEAAPVRFVPGAGAEVTVLGWHGGVPKVSRLLVTAREGLVTVRRVDLAPGVYLAPTLGGHAIPPNMTDEQLVKVALLQQSIAVRHGLNMCVGGDVEVTEISAAGITVRKIGEYPDKAMTAARIAKMDDAEQDQVAA